tara:strand:- start:174 stop:1325 length:1152 start_codon:yes stop_codon:yes gene_type:complete
MATIKDRHTNERVALSSYEQRDSLKKELLTQMHDKKIHDLLVGVDRFDGVVLNYNTFNDSTPTTTANDQTGLYIIASVRPLLRHAKILPNPCDSKYRNHPDMVDFIISLHPIARSTVSLASGKAISISVGDVVSCRRVEEGKDVWRFDFTKKNTTIGKADFNCLKKKSSTFNNTGASLLGAAFIAVYTGAGPGLNAYNTDHAQVGKHDGADESGGKGLKWLYVGNHPNWKGKVIYNGSLPGELLGYAKVGKGHGKHRTTPLMREVVENYDALAQAFEDKWGEPLRASGYRPFAKQVQSKKLYGGMAATPGRSNHGWGLAFDIKGKKWHRPPHTFEIPEYKWMVANAGRYGFFNPPWAAKGTCSKQCEPWHWEWQDKGLLVKKI